jgi:SAM-dependent methyltransferase
MSSQINPNLYAKLLKLLGDSFPIFCTQWVESRKKFGEEWETLFCESVGRIISPKADSTWNDLLSGYAEFCTDAIRSHIYFEKHGCYQASNYDEVDSACYQNKEFMDRRYLPGLYLSHFIWPHHYKMLLNYRDSFLSRICDDEINLFYEIGTGCGIYSQLTLARLPQSQGLGIDISQSSLNFTNRIMRANNLEGRYAVSNQNILNSPMAEKADFVICQELLEHLEDPDQMVSRLFDSVKSGGWGYITAAINAGHIDHIYLYRKPEEVEAQITAAGWEIVDVQIESNYEEKPIEFRPTIVGYLTKKP